MDRLNDLLPVLQEMPSDVFWRVLQNEWRTCQPTWPHKDDLLALMRRHAKAAPYRGGDLHVYRGCSGYRVRGITWTTDRNAAVDLARASTNPVVMQARAPGKWIFMRLENDVVLDPARLINLQGSNRLV
jgi:hypothetical protein